MTDDVRVRRTRLGFWEAIGYVDRCPVFVWGFTRAHALHRAPAAIERVRRRLERAEEKHQRREQTWEQP